VTTYVFNALTWNCSTSFDDHQHDTSKFVKLPDDNGSSRVSGTLPDGTTNLMSVRHDSRFRLEDDSHQKSAISHTKFTRPPRVEYRSTAPRHDPPTNSQLLWSYRNTSLVRRTLSKVSKCHKISQVSGYPLPYISSNNSRLSRVTSVPCDIIWH
jgi:hypothetical protein